MQVGPDHRAAFSPDRREGQAVSAPPPEFGAGPPEVIPPVFDEDLIDNLSTDDGMSVTDFGGTGFDEQPLDQLLDDALTPGPEREDQAVGLPRLLCGRRKGSPRKLVRKDEQPRASTTPQQRLLLLDT